MFYDNAEDREKYFTEYETLREEEIKEIQQETAKDILNEVGKVCGDYQWFKNLCKQYGLK